MKPITTAIITVLLLATAAGAESLETLAARAIDAHQEIESIKKEMKAAAGTLPDESRTVQQAIRVFDEEPLTSDQIAELDAQVARERERLASLQTREDYAPAVSRVEREIELLKLKRKIGLMTDESDRAAFRAELEATRDALREKSLEIQTPFRDRIERIASTVNPDNPALAEAMKPFFPEPTGTFDGAAPGQFNFSMRQAFGGMEWRDADGNQVAWAHLRMRPRSEIQDHDRENLLDGIHPVRSASEHDIWVWAGNFLVSFVISDESLKDAVAIETAVGELIDLDGLAAVEVVRASSVAGADAEH